LVTEKYGYLTNIKLISRNNMGAHHTLNEAIDMASYNYIAVLNSDDQFIENKLERCSSILSANKSIDLIFGNVEFISEYCSEHSLNTALEWMERSHRFYDKFPFLALSLLNENFSTTTSNFVFKKTLWNKIGGFAELRYCHDLEFLMNAFSLGNVYFDSEFSHINYRIHDSNTISEDVNKVNLEVASVVAATLINNGTNLYEGERSKFSYSALMSMLSNKNLKDQIIYLMLAYKTINNRSNYYKNISTLNPSDFF
jgi:glycosyltransferase involved in cell wall biosynthesis